MGARIIRRYDDSETPSCFGSFPQLEFEHGVLLNVQSGKWRRKLKIELVVGWKVLACYIFFY